jgi:aspartate/methionine/tyrosine aminotransferase
MPPSESRRMRGVQPPIVPIVARWIRETPGTVSLGQGMVSYGPPPEALEAAAAFGADPDQHRYGAVEGEPGLLAAIERKLEAENGLIVRPDSRVVVTAGSNMAFVAAMLAITDPGDEVILQAPYYFNHEMAIAIAGCRAVSVETDGRYGLQPDAIARAITTRTRAVVTVSPNNPSGAVYTEAALRAVNAICRERGVFHVHDEAYEYFLYEGAEHVSPGAIAGASGHTISLFSLSKSYGFASWRIGYMVIPDGLFDAINKIQDTNLICAPLVSQCAAAAALGVGRSYCRARLPGLARARRHVLDRLAGVTDLCDVPPAPGAFYLLLRIRSVLDAVTLAERLVREHRVAVIPGSAFGLTSGCYLRVSYGALDESLLAEGVSRLVAGLRAIAG